jgi:hypothetical protein
MASPTVSAMSNKNGNDSVLSASNGTFVLNSTSVYNAFNFKAIVVLEDTVFASIKHTLNNTDVRSTYLGTVGGTVKAGAIIRPLDNKKFGSVQLTSGSVNIVL